MWRFVLLRMLVEYVLQRLQVRPEQNAAQVQVAGGTSRGGKEGCAPTNRTDGNNKGGGVLAQRFLVPDVWCLFLLLRRTKSGIDSRPWRLTWLLCTSSWPPRLTATRFVSIQMSVGRPDALTA